MFAGFEAALLLDHVLLDARAAIRDLDERPGVVELRAAGLSEEDVGGAAEAVVAGLALRAVARVGVFRAAFPSAPSAHLLRLVPLLAAAFRAAA